MNNNRRWLFYDENGDEDFSPLFVTSINNLPSILQTFYNYEATSENYVLNSSFVQYMSENNYDEDTPFVAMLVSSGTMRENYRINNQLADRTQDILIVLDYTIGIAEFDQSEGDAPWNMEWIKNNLNMLNEECEEQASYIFGGFVYNGYQV